DRTRRGTPPPVRDLPAGGARVALRGRGNPGLPGPTMGERRRGRLGGIPPLRAGTPRFAADLPVRATELLDRCDPTRHHPGPGGTRHLGLVPASEVAGGRPATRIRVTQG